MQSCEETRRQNLQRILDEDFPPPGRGQLKRANDERFKFADQSLLSRLLSRNKSRKPIGEKLARTIEKKSARPQYWLDTDHTGILKTKLATTELRAFIDVCAELPPGFRDHLLRQAKRLRTYADQLPTIIATSIQAPTEDAKYDEWSRSLERDMRQKIGVTR
jgi:hypothetical protein